MPPSPLPLSRASTSVVKADVPSWEFNLRCQGPALDQRAGTGGFSVHCPGGLLAVWFPARVIWFAFGWLDGRVCFSYELQNFALSGKELSLSRGWLEENSFHCPRLCLSGREDELLRITSNDGREHLPSLPAVLSSHGRLEGLTEALQQGAAVAG